MAKFIFDGVGALFGPTLIVGTADWMAKVINALTTFFNDGKVTVAYNIFAGIACSLMIAFFLIDGISQASRDMLTIERLVIMFIKLMIGMMLLLYLKEILDCFFQLGSGLYGMASEQFDPSQAASSTGIQYFTHIDTVKDNSVWPTWEEVKASFEGKFGSRIKVVLQNLGTMITIAIPYFICMLARVAAYFVATSNALMLMARAIFAPLGVVQCFEDGQRSAGIRYLKKFVAEALTFVVILGVLYAASLLTSTMMTNVMADLGIESIEFDNLDNIITFKTIIPPLVVQLAALGGIMSASKLAHDIAGAN